MEVSTKEVLARIAQLALMEVPNRQIAQAVRLSDGRISQLQATDEYKAVLAEMSVEHYEKQKVVNDGWDMLEAKAINGLMVHMNMTSDPNLMLRVAAVANKATRRGQFQNNPLNAAGAAGARVVIQLQNSFIDRLQNNYQINVNGKPSLTVQKQSDTISAARLQQILGSGKKDAAGDLLPDVPNLLEGAVNHSMLGVIEE